MPKRMALSAMLLVVLCLSVFAPPAHASRFTCLFLGIGCPAGPSGVAGSGDVPQPVVAPAFVPVYEPSPMLLSPFSVSPRSLNVWYFATQSTADEICKRVTACQSVVLQIPCDMGGGPNTCTAPERMLVFSDGTPNQNAGLLASYFTRNPEDQFPGVAMNLINAVLAPLRKQ